MPHRKKQPEIQGDHRPEYSAHTNSAPWYFMPAFDRILQLARMEEMDCEFVEVTAHEGARPTHAVWQSRFYHRGGAVVQDGERYEDLKPLPVTAPAPACAAGTAATTFTRSTPASPCATTRTNAWPNWTPAISPTAAGCTPGTRSPRCSGRWNAGCASTSAVTWPRPPPGWMPAKAPPS